MNLTFLNHRTSRPIAPESFGATEVGNAAAALTSWIASGLLKGADAGKSYSFSSALTIPNGTVIEGTLNLIWTGAADIPVLTIGDCEIENLSITVPSTSGNTASISTGYKGRSITVAGPGTSGTTFLTIADTAGLDLDLFECTGGFQRPLVLGNKAAWSTGGRIGFARIRDYTRAIGINYLDGFRLEGYDIHTRHAEATYEPGHNGILASGLRNSYIAKGSIKDAGEHLFRLGGAAAMGASYNNDFGDMTLDNPGGSFIKLNADAIAYDLRFGDVVSVGRFMTAPGGNRELLRLSHVRDVSFGRVSLTLGEGAVWSAQDALALNDATDISIAHLHVDGIQQSVIDCVSGQDIGDGLGNGDVRNITIGGLTGNDPNTKPIVKLAMDAGFEASGLSIHGMDYFTDGALVTASGTTVVDGDCAISGRLRKTDLTALPSVSNLPVLMAVDLSVGDQKIINQSGTLVVQQSPNFLVIQNKTALTAISPAQFTGSVSTRINAAITAAASDGADVALTGEYLVEGPILLQPGVKLIGMHSATLKRPDLSAGYDLVNLGTEGDGFALQGIAFDGNRDEQAVEDYLGGLVIIDGSSTGITCANRQMKFENCRFEHFSRGAMGLHVKGVDGMIIDQCWFEDGGGNSLYHPIYLRRVKDVTVTNNTLKNVMYHAIKVQALEPFDRIVIAGNTVDGAGRGVYVAEAGNVSIFGNTLTNIIGDAANDGAISVVAGSSAFDPKNVSVTGNSISRCSVSGISLNGVAQASITGNAITDCAASAIRVRGTSRFIISGNAITWGDLSGLVSDGLGGYVAEASLTVNGIYIEDAPSTSTGVIGANVYRSASAATSRGIYSDATGGAVQYDAAALSQMTSVTTPISETTSGVLQCLIKPVTITPQGQMSGSGNGVILGQQGSAATWNLRGDVFQSINMVRNRASGAGAASLWYGWSSGDSATGWIAINPDGTPRIRTGKGLLIEDATGVDLLNIKSTGVVVGLATTVASLPAAASNTYGRVYVSDSTVAASGNFGAIVAGGGANKVPLWSDGANWLIG